MKHFKKYLLTLLAGLVLSLTPTPAMAQSEDLGAILAANPELQQWIGTSGCNICTQSCFSPPFNQVDDALTIWMVMVYIPWYVENYVPLYELSYWLW